MKTIPYARQFIDNDDIKAVVTALRSDYLTQGPRVSEFEDAVASYCNAKYAVAVNSGTAALHIACLAAGLSPGNEAITSPITFVASANCIAYCGARPVFADVRPDTVCIDPEEVAKKMTARTKVVIPVDFAGQPAELAAIQSLTAKKKIVVIEDAAHSLGATYKGVRVGSNAYSDMTILSFHPVKHITTGEGGMVLTNDRALYKKLMLLRSHGITRDPAQIMSGHGPWYYEMQVLGYNYRITDVQCALGLNQLKKLDSFIAMRKQVVQEYRHAFRKYEQILLLEEHRHGVSSHHLFVIRFRRSSFKVGRDAIFNEYRKNGVLVNVHYIPVYQHPYYRKAGYGYTRCAVAEQYYEETITLPLYAHMPKNSVRTVIAVTEKIIRKFAK